MQITVIFDQEVAERMLIEQHEKVYGPPPVGQKWKCSGLYCGITIENAPIKQATIEEPVKTPVYDSSEPF